MIRVDKRSVGYLVLFIILLQSLGFGISGKLFIAVFMPVEVCFLLYNIMRDGNFWGKAAKLCRYTPFIYLFIYYFWAIITVYVSIMKGTFYFGSFINGFIGGLTFSVILGYLSVYFILKEGYISIREFIKFLTIYYLFIYVMGIVQYIANVYSVDILNNFMVLFNNKGALLFDKDPLNKLAANRIQSIFDEPSNLGGFIYSNLPIIYAIGLSRYKIFESKVMSKAVKMILIPMTLLTLIMAMSPMSLVFAIFVTLLYFSKGIVVFLRRHIVKFTFIISIFLIISVFAMMMVKSSDIRVLKRIAVSIPNLFNLETLIVVEESLATRIINYIIMLKAGIDNIVFGVGYGNLAKYFVELMKMTTMPLTPEQLFNMQNGFGSPASATFFRVFAETGLIGLILVINFYYRSLWRLIKGRRYFEGIEGDFCKGIIYFIIVQMTFVFFYNSTLHDTYAVMLMGVSGYMIMSLREKAARGYGEFVKVDERGER